MIQWIKDMNNRRKQQKFEEEVKLWEKRIKRWEFMFVNVKLMMPFDIVSVLLPLLERRTHALIMAAQTYNYQKQSSSYTSPDGDYKIVIVEFDGFQFHAYELESIGNKR